MSVKAGGSSYSEDQEQELGGDSPRGASISPGSMVDSVADWSLPQVIDHLKKKEHDVGKLSTSVRIHCRSTIKLLMDVIASLAFDYGVSRNRMCQWLSYHGAAIAKDDITVNKLIKIQSEVRKACIQDDDTDTMDLMNSLIPYSPKVLDERSFHLCMYDEWTASIFDELSRVCGVYRYHIAQVYVLKSILSCDTDNLGESGIRLSMEVSRWGKWMNFRLDALGILAKSKLE